MTNPTPRTVSISHLVAHAFLSELREDVSGRHGYGIAVLTGPADAMAEFAETLENALEIGDHRAVPGGDLMTAVTRLRDADVHGNPHRSQLSPAQWAALVHADADGALPNNTNWRVTEVLRSRGLVQGAGPETPTERGHHQALRLSPPARFGKGTEWQGQRPVGTAPETAPTAPEPTPEPELPEGTVPVPTAVYIPASAYSAATILPDGTPVYLRIPGRADEQRGTTVGRRDAWQVVQLDTGEVRVTNPRLLTPA